MRLLVGVILFCGTLAVMFADWRGQQGQTVDVIGSTSVQPFAEMLAESYGHEHHDIAVDVQGGGSTVGVQSVIDAIADIGMCSRSLKKEEADLGLSALTIAFDGLAIVVHPSNSVEGLTRPQIRQIFAGELANWSSVGGPDRPIRLIVREESSGTREAFMNLIMGKTRVSRRALNQDSNGAIKELVKADPAAVGFMSLGLVTAELKALKVDDVEPSSATVMSKKYPLVRPFLFVTRGSPPPAAQRFIDFVLSSAGQQVLEKEGLVRVK